MADRLYKVGEIKVETETPLNDQISHWKEKYDLMEKDHKKAEASKFVAEEELGELSERAEQLGNNNKLYCRELEVYGEREKAAQSKYEMLLANFKMLERENREKLAVYEEREKREAAKYEKLLEDFQRLERENKEKVAKKEGATYDKLLQDFQRLERQHKEMVAFYEEREKREGTKYEKLLEEFETLKKDDMEMLVKNSELGSARVKVERQLEIVKKWKEQLKLRATQKIVQPNVVKEKEMDTQNGNSTKEKVKEVALNRQEKARQRKDVGASFVIRSCDKRPKSYTAGGKFESGVLIEISDSDDEMPLQIQNQIPNHLVTGSKRKRGPLLGCEQRENDRGCLTMDELALREGVENKNEAGDQQKRRNFNERLYPSFKLHIASKLLKDIPEDREPLTCRQYKIRNWILEDEDQVVVDLVKGSPLYTLVMCSYQVANRALVSAFIERWHPETNTFHLPCGEMTITLDDVYDITRLPIKGKPLTAKIPRETNYYIAQVLGISHESARDELAMCRGKSVRLSWLSRTFSKKGPNTFTAEQVARAYLLYLLGCTLFYNKSGDKVCVKFLKYLEDLSTIGQWAWGVGGLAYLYRMPRKASRVEAKSMAGYLTIFEAWVYEHFPNLRPKPTISVEPGVPRSLQWRPK